MKKNAIVISGFMAFLIVIVMISGCTSTAKPKCPICNNSDKVVSFVNADKDSDFKCENCSSIHYNKTGFAVPEPGWNVVVYKEKITGWKLSEHPNEIVFIGDSGKQYTDSQL